MEVYTTLEARLLPNILSRCKTLFFARKDVYTVLEAKQGRAPADNRKIG